MDYRNQDQRNNITGSYGTPIQNGYPAPGANIQKTDNPSKDTGDTHKIRTHDLSDFHLLRIIGIILLTLVVCMIAWTIINEGSVIISNLMTHIARLFNRASINPYNTKGFANFIQLILIAIFVGWTINRFRKK